MKIPRWCKRKNGRTEGDWVGYTIPPIIHSMRTKSGRDGLKNGTPVRPWDIIGADMCTFDNKHYLCIVDYHSKFKKTKDISADTLILTCKIIFTEYRLPKKVMSDSGSNFVSGKFKTFCKSLNIEQAFLSSYHHQSNGQVEAGIKFIKCTLKKSFDSRSDPHIVLLQIPTTQLGQGLPSPAMMLFNFLIRGIMPVINRPPIGIDNDDEHHKVIIKRQTKMTKTNLLPKILSPHRVYFSGST